MKAKITATLIKTLKTTGKRYRIWDTQIQGFNLRVTATGRRLYVLTYRFRGKLSEYSLGVHGNITPEQARTLAKKLSGQVASNIDIKQERLERIQESQRGRNATLGVFIDEKYEEWAKIHHKGYRETLRCLRNDFKHLSAYKLGDISKWEIQQWITRMLTKGLTKPTINRRVSCLKGALTKACEWDVIDKSPLHGMSNLKIDNVANIRYLSPEEENRLREALLERQEGQRLARNNHSKWREIRSMTTPSSLNGQFTDHLMPITLLALNTGMRRGEIFNLNWQDIDFYKRILTVTGEISKGGKTRHIPLSKEAHDTLTKWQDSTTLEGLVFKSPQSGQKIDNISTSWQNLLKKANITNFRFHDLRHHFASKLVMNGVDLNTVRELLGHSDFTTTLRYAHLAPEHKAKAIAVLDDN
jgi:integrase